MKVTTVGGGLTGVVIGREQRLVLVGPGDPANGSASTNTLTEVGSTSDAEAKFGKGSRLAEAIADARANGANVEYLYGVMPSEVSASESFTTTASGTLTNTPILDTAGAVTATDDGASASVDVEFRFWTGTDLTNNAPSTSNTMYVNPITGEWAADASSSYTINYTHHEWSTAFSEAATAYRENETGVLGAVSDAESVVSMAQTEAASLRSNYKLVTVAGGAEPMSDDGSGNAQYDTATYSDGLDADYVFLCATSRADGRDQTAAGLAGKMAGNDLHDPIFNDGLNGFQKLSQELTVTEADDMRDAGVIPLRHVSTIKLDDNTSTSTATDWERDFWTRRVVDQVVLISRAVGEAIVGRVNNDETRNVAEDEIRTEIIELVKDGLLEPNDTENDDIKWRVEVYQDTNDPTQANVDVGITPEGVVKRVDETLTING